MLWVRSGFRWCGSGRFFSWGLRALAKTAIFYQLAQELGVNLVSYTMTHHTRQSALGLPVLWEKTFGGKTYTATEYTMSEDFSQRL